MNIKEILSKSKLIQKQEITELEYLIIKAVRYSTKKMKEYIIKRRNK